MLWVVLLDTFVHVTDHALKFGQWKSMYIESSCMLLYAVFYIDCMIWVDHHCKHAIVTYGCNVKTVEYLIMVMSCNILFWGDWLKVSDDLVGGTPFFLVRRSNQWVGVGTTGTQLCCESGSDERFGLLIRPIDPFHKKWNVKIKTKYFNWVSFVQSFLVFDFLTSSYPPFLFSLSRSH